MEYSTDVQDYIEYVEDHKDQRENYGNILSEDRMPVYKYKPLGIQMGDKIEKINKVIAVRYFLRPGEKTLDGFPIIALWKWP